MLTVHYFAAAKAARGVETEELDISALGNGSPTTLADVLAHLGSTHTEGRASGKTLTEVFARCTFLVDGTSSRREDAVPSTGRLDIMPPFAGG
ncbi:MoaD/ThiS family protein [Kocuria massiliensis]|uniref:MoaD/ThiS family protein n=1 Tax=Kocuria massiliensis TaxID=1926282 RepID=UPI001C483BF4|nr:MoaD/ThiS family protein [Kocuria massiliensis]